MDIKDESGAKKKEANEKFGGFIIGLINRFIVLIDNYLKLKDKSKGLILVK